MTIFSWADGGAHRLAGIVELVGTLQRRIADWIRGRALAAGEIEAEIGAEALILLLALKVLMGERACVESEITRTGHDLARSEMGIATDGDIHRVRGNETRLFGNPVRRPGARTATDLDTGDEALPAAEAKAARGGFVRGLTGIGNGDGGKIAADFGRHCLTGNERAGECRVVAGLDDDVAGTGDVAVDLSSSVGVRPTVEALAPPVSPTPTPPDRLTPPPMPMLAPADVLLDDELCVASALLRVISLPAESVISPALSLSDVTGSPLAS